MSGAGRKFGRIGRLRNRARGSKNEAAVDNLIRITVRGHRTKPGGFDWFQSHHAVVGLALRDLKEGVVLEQVPSGKFCANWAGLALRSPRPHPHLLTGQSPRVHFSTVDTDLLSSVVDTWDQTTILMCSMETRSPLIATN